MRLFWRQGYAATSVEDLTAALHVSRSSLYDTFGDKRSLFLEALKLYSDRVLSLIAQTLSAAPTPLAGIQQIFDDLSAGIGQDAGATGCFMVNSVAELVPYDPEVTKLSTAYAKALQGLIQARLTEARAQNSLTQAQTPEQLAAYVYNTIQGMRVLIKAGATHAQMQAISALTLKSLQP